MSLLRAYCEAEIIVDNVPPLGTVQESDLQDAIDLMIMVRGLIKAKSSQTRWTKKKKKSATMQLTMHKLNAEVSF